MIDAQVLIIGAGLSGLSCAYQLKRAGISFRLHESSDDVGGRVRTDSYEGFLLDRGFQVLLTAYPETQQLLDYKKLHLSRFEPGALIRYQGRFQRFADPWRRPQHLISTAFSPVASFTDKLRVASLRRSVRRGSLEELYERPEMTTMDFLREKGFSEIIIQRFFKPFLGGIFLESELSTSSRMFEFVFRMFSLGDAALPAAGMQAIARQIADQLPANSLVTNSRVSNVTADSVMLTNGQQRSAQAVVVACDQPSANQLLGITTTIKTQTVHCLYYSAEKSPITEPILVLNGDSQGPINNLCVPSQVVASYAPADRSLISVSVLEADAADCPDLEQAVRTQLGDWFGLEVNHWQHLKSYDIRYALPDQSPPALTPVAKPIKRTDGIYICGDYLDTASIQGALLTGRRVAERIIDDLST